MITQVRLRLIGKSLPNPPEQGRKFQIRLVQVHDLSTKLDKFLPLKFFVMPALDSSNSWLHSDVTAHVEAEIKEVKSYNNWGKMRSHN
jgi:hypothetical protein